MQGYLAHAATAGQAEKQKVEAEKKARWAAKAQKDRDEAAAAKAASCLPSRRLV